MEDDDPHETFDDSLLREVAAAPPVAVPPDLATFVLLEPGTVVDGAFRIEARLGAGGMGIVYAARDLTLDREVALKLMRVDRGQSQIGAKLPDVFEREARATARLNHPNIVTLHQFGKWNGLLYLVLERLRGETLNARMERGGVPLPDGLWIMEQVARALVHTHAAGITHRDLKPQNVFLLADGAVKVLDFGVSGLNRMSGEPRGGVLSGSRSTLSLAGTPGYMAPEQWDGAMCGPYTDVFAVGVMLYQLVTGTLPFGATPVDLWARAPRLDGKVPEEADDLVELIASCLEPRRAARLSDARVLVERLHAIRTALGDMPGRAVASERGALATARVRSRSWKRVAVAATISMAIVGGAASLRAPSTNADACSQPHDLGGLWDPMTRGRFGAFFNHSATWTATARILDRYAGQWVPLRESACRAADTSAQVCLDDRRTAFAHYIEKLGSLKAEAALASARGLPAVADCSDPDYVARFAHPEGPPRRDPRALIPFALTVTGVGRDIVHAATFVDGDLVIAGFASADSTLAGVHLQAPASADDRFGFIARIGLDGRLRWVRIADKVSPLSLATSRGTVVVGGWFAPNARIDDVEIAAGRTKNDGMIAALDANTGAVRWVRPLGSSSPASAIRSLRSDRDGNLYGAGDFAGEATFGGATAFTTVKSSERSPFIASWTPDGVLRWVQAASGNVSSTTWSVAVDGESVVFATWMRGAASFAGKTLAGDGSCVIGRLATTTGEAVWIHRERGATARCIADAIAIQGDRVAVSGRQYFATPSGWLAELALADGSVRWVQPLGTSEHDAPKALAFGPDGTLAAGGHYTTETMAVGPFSLISNGSWDGFVATFDRTGKPLGALGLGGATSDVVRWIAVGPQGQLVVGGRFESEMRVGDRTLRGAAGTDGYLVELSPRSLTAARPLPASSASP